LSTLALYFHTLRYLRPIQWAGRAWFRLRRPRPDLRAPPPLRARRGPHAEAIPTAQTLLGPDSFRFLNLERRCATAEDWQPSNVALLWAYHLHYFDDLNAADAAQRHAWHLALLERWTAENPPGHGVGWEPYPVSRRIVNSVKWALRGNELPAAYRASLAIQARWLEQRLEYHILGNHLLSNAKALIHAGLYFDGQEAERWCARGLAMLARELPEQVLPDGGHFELSTMYHAAVLEDLLDVVNVLRVNARKPPAGCVDAIDLMQGWLRVMTHPDGEIAFFNDAAFDVAPPLAALADYAMRIGLQPASAEDAPLKVLESSGYVRVRGHRAYLICDCAAVGPDYLPGHAHADTLSFELSLAGRRVFVNSGTSQYGADAERQRQRGTAAHNTVVVNGQDSSEVWAGFRVARRARARLHAATSAPPASRVDASHDGYRRLPGRNVHRRRWTLEAGSLLIEDEISGTLGSAVAFFHLHPTVEARALGASEVVLDLPEGCSAQVSFAGAAQVEVRSGTWHPRFGVALGNRCIVVRLAGAALTTRIRWDA
jgi:uncharacterized heparinase superfamily protein